MSLSESIVFLAVEFVCGAASGLVFWRWTHGRSFGRTAASLIGGAGGLLLTWLAARIPGVGHFVGHIESAADATMRGVGGITPVTLVGVGLAGLLGGIALTALVGCFRSGKEQ